METPYPTSGFGSASGKSPRAFPVPKVYAAKPRQHFLYQKYARQIPESISCIKSIHGKTPLAFPVSKVRAAKPREHF